MRIAYDHQIFGLQRHGGISRYFAELVENLQSVAGIQPTVVAPVYVNEYLLRADVRRRVRGRHWPWRFRGSARVVGALNSMLLPLSWSGGRFDIVHETYYSLTHRGRSRVRVLTIYDMIHERFPQEFPDVAQVTRAKRVAAERADHIICISETTKRDAVEILGIPAEKCSVIYLGCTLAPVAGLTANPRSRPYMLYVGNRNEYKNFAVMIRAFAESAYLRKHFDLVAFGGPAFTPAEREQLQSAGIEQQTHHARGDDASLQAHYAAATAFVYPSRYEGFGIPPLEAMANDCPVACSTAGSISEVVGDAGAYFDPDDAPTLARALERISQDQNYAADLRARGKRRIELYSWSKCAAQTLATYRQLAQLPGSG